MCISFTRHKAKLYIEKHKIKIRIYMLSYLTATRKSILWTCSQFVSGKYCEVAFVDAAYTYRVPVGISRFTASNEQMYEYERMNEGTNERTNGRMNERMKE